LVENKCVPFFLAALLLPLSAAAGKSTLEDIDRLLEAGAVMLALHVIAQEQPEFSSSPFNWQRWERRRLAILESRADWPVVIERVTGYPASLPDDFSISARESLTRSHLAVGNAEAAGTIIAGLIWGTAQDTAMVGERIARLERWRALLVESRLLAGQTEDAQTTVLRYRLDYGDDPGGWRLAHAKASIRAGRSDEARELLAGLETTEVAYMKLLLRAGDASVDPVELLSEMAPMLGEGRLVAAQRAQLWASLAGAAARYRDHEVRVTSMEQAVALRGPLQARDRFVRVDADDLWDAYEDYAAALGNEAHLLVGRFDAWLALAEQYSGVGDVKARALYAYLAIQNRDPRAAGIARTGLVTALAQQPRGLRILGALYLDSRRYPDIAAIPPALRAPLVAHALAESRLDVAGQLLTGLDRQARQALPLRWRAPVAVALIGNDRVDEALPLFGEDFAAGENPKPMLVEALVRVALALQTAGEYAHSARLLSRALAFATSPWERRELLLLAAESEARAGQHERAARHYIESAAVPGGGPADTWSRAARLQAARSLAQAGLDADAVGVLESTLADSPPADARVLVEHVLRRF
jgi:tetratricopeptide (TPR) repeat protein